MPSKAAAFFENGIGNSIIFTSALQAISSWWCHGGTVDLVVRRDYKDSRISDIKDIMSQLPFIGRVIDFPGKGFESSQYKFTYKSGHGGGGIGIPGFKSIPTPQNRWTMLLMHEAEFYTYELYLRGYRGPLHQPAFPSVPSPVEVDNSKINIALCNGTFKTNHWLKKQWPESSWEKLVTKFEKVGYVCWWIGGGSDKDLGAKLVDEEHNLAGKISMVESGGLIQDCNVTISTDTAIAHAAAALNLDQVVLWGGTLLSKNYPLNSKGELSVLRVKGLSCSPCFGTDRFNACKNYRCMQLLGVDEVEAATKKILNKRGFE